MSRRMMKKMPGIRTINLGMMRIRADVIWIPVTGTAGECRLIRGDTITGMGDMNKIT